ncbi:MAG: hypothetical protein IH931_08815, partial [candidate division Zixibacteria bacterium]|nr:hypothetical protein [candidate division Zixibacteria bacterium]
MGTHKVILTAAVFLLAAVSAAGQTIESLYVDSSVSTRPITSEINSRGAPDGSEASITGKLANAHTWTFDFDSTVNPGAPINSVEIFITHRQIGLSNDSLVLEYFDGTSYIPFESMGNVTATLTAVGPFSASAITATNQINGFQVRMRGVSKIGAPDDFTYFVDAIELRVTRNTPPVLTLIGPKTTNEGITLSFAVSATDADATTPTLSTSALPAGAV